MLGCAREGVCGVDTREVADAMVRSPAVHPSGTTIAQARMALEDPHRHLLLIVSRHRLLGTLDRSDLSGPAGGAEPALSVARMTGRIARPDDELAAVHAEMLGRRQRRRAVVHDSGALLGLLCLKASGAGFCTEEGIAARQGRAIGGRHVRPPGH